MKYDNEIIIRKTIFVKPENLPLIQPGDIFTNSLSGHAKDQIIYDGKIDFRNTNYPSTKAQKEGRFLIDHKKRTYQYVVRPTKNF